MLMHNNLNDDEYHLSFAFLHPWIFIHYAGNNCLNRGKLKFKKESKNSMNIFQRTSKKPNGSVIHIWTEMLGGPKIIVDYNFGLSTSRGHSVHLQ